MSLNGKALSTERAFFYNSFQIVYLTMCNFLFTIWLIPVYYSNLRDKEYG